MSEVKYTHILSCKSEMNDGYILGVSPLASADADALFRGQRILESQFMPKMPVIVILHNPPEKAIHVAEKVYLLASKHFDLLNDIEHFLVNEPFCEMVDVTFLEIFDVLTNNPDLLLDKTNTYMIGCVYAA